MYWINLYKDIVIWRRFAKVAKASIEELEKHNLRVDNLGRIYTVVNLPEEMNDGNEYMHEAWVLQNLGPYNKVLQEIGLAGYAFPEVSRIEEPGTNAYLVVLYPLSETIGIWPFTKNLLIWTSSFIAIKIAYNITNNLGLFESISNLLKKYVF